MFYLGIYSYGTCATTMQNRAMRLALYDAAEQTGLLLGTVVSPTLLNATGYTGTHLLAIMGGTLSLMYLLLVVPGKNM